MKARTKAEKRRGRPKKLGVARTPSGQISRVKEQPSLVALEARARMHNLSIERARDQQAGTFLGRLHMAFLAWEKSGKEDEQQQPAMSISTRQYFALLQYRELHNDYLKAIGAPGAYYEPHYGAGGDPEAHERWCRAIKAAYKSARDAIQEAQNYQKSHNLWAALDYSVLREEEHAHMVGAVRELGNALARFFARA